MRKEFPRVAPEAVGVPSALVEWLIDELEQGWTEPHSLMLMRHGKVFAEGWWSPYAAGLRHSQQSLSKTYAATAIGIACTEGLLKLTDRIVDIFPDKIPAEPSENLKKLTIHDVLCMGNGMDSMPKPSEEWLRDFLAIPVEHTPGTVFMYNSTGSTVLAAIIRRVTGMGLHEYLTPRLYEKLGIDTENLRWMKMLDGTEIGGGGLFSTTEDNLRLIKLYHDGGVWNGERILSEDYVRRATTMQNDNSYIDAGPDARMGYGYQMWLCQPGGFRADGAGGQFAISLPKYDMMISITEYSNDTQRVLNTFWEMLKRLPDADVLPEDPEAAAKLAFRMRKLSLPAPRATDSPLSAEINGKRYKVTDGTVRFAEQGALRMMAGAPEPQCVNWLEFNFSSGCCRINFGQDDGEYSLAFATDGSRRENEMGELPSRALCSAEWLADDTLELDFRWIELYNPKKLTVQFESDALTIKTPPTFRTREPISCTAKLV